MIPLANSDERVHVFLANRGDGNMPHEQIAAVLLGVAPLPSFGTMLSFKLAYLERLFGSIENLDQDFLNQPIQITPGGDFEPYRQIMGGFVPVVVDGQPLYVVDTVGEVMANLSRYGNANSMLSRVCATSCSSLPGKWMIKLEIFAIPRASQSLMISRF